MGTAQGSGPAIASSRGAPYHARRPLRGVVGRAPEAPSTTHLANDPMHPRSRSSLLELGLLALGTTLLAACANTNASRAGVDLGSVPPEVIELYDQATPTGLIELEIDRNGRVREMEADIPVRDLPQVVADAALRHLPAGRVTGAEREFTARGEAYEVKFDVQGVAWEVVVDERGRILETEQAIDFRSAPAAVIATSERAVKDSLLLSVEIITRGDEQEYHVKRQRFGASFKIVIAPDGTLLRAVREAKAEIEIPLVD